MYKMHGANIIGYKGKSPKLDKSCFVASGAQLIGDLEMESKQVFGLTLSLELTAATYELEHDPTSKTTQ